MSLFRLGFKPSEVVRATTWPDGRVGVFAEYGAEEEVLLQICTETSRSLILQGSFVHHHEIPVLWKDRPWGIGHMERLTVFNRSYTPGQVYLYGDPQPDYGRAYAGEVGMGLLRESILGIDAAAPLAALSVRSSLRDSFRHAFATLPLELDDHDGLPFARAGTAGGGSRRNESFLVATGKWSCIYSSRVPNLSVRRRLIHGARRLLKREGTFQVPLHLSAGVSIVQPMRVKYAPPAHLDGLASRPLVGILGFDFLRRWMTVFDFPGRELALFDYALDGT